MSRPTPPRANVVYVHTKWRHTRRPRRRIDVPSPAQSVVSLLTRFVRVPTWIALPSSLRSTLPTDQYGVAAALLPAATAARRTTAARTTPVLTRGGCQIPAAPAPPPRT